MNARLMTLLDDAMTQAARSRGNVGREVRAIDMHVSFLRPAAGQLVATGRSTGGGRSVCFCEAEVADDRGAVVAKAMGTFRYDGPVVEPQQAPQATPSP